LRQLRLTFQGVLGYPIGQRRRLPRGIKTCGERMLSGYFWVVVGFVIVAVTKYLTSIRLRSLAEKMQRERNDASELRSLLIQAEEKENALLSEADTLQNKMTALKNVVGNIERSVQRYQRGGAAETPSEEAVQAR